MPDFNAPKLYSKDGWVRTQPFADEASAAPAPIDANAIPSPSAQSRVASAGSSQIQSPTVANATADNEITPDEEAELKAAADAGDEEAHNLLLQMGIVGGTAAMVGSALRLARRPMPIGISDSGPVGGMGGTSGLPAVRDIPVTQLNEQVINAIPAPQQRLLTGPSSNRTIAAPQKAISPPVDVIPDGQDHQEFYQARRNRASAAEVSAKEAAPLQYREFYQARQLKDAARRARRMIP